MDEEGAKNRARETWRGVSAAESLMEGDRQQRDLETRTRKVKGSER